MTNRGPSFTFAISLSVLNHLGRHLYRSFATVLGEAISNSWDADARTVRIYLDPARKGFWIKDDGIGMTANDFQQKFLKIGYSKRKERSTSAKGRPYIGRKGIGKLALLSCANRISVLSRVEGGPYVGGIIDNSNLDQAITDDLTPQEYTLGVVDQGLFAKYTKGHQHGTIIRFEGMKDGVKRSFDFLRKLIALYFRFSLLDKDFKIFLDDVQVTYKDLKELSEKTEFLWKLDSHDDPFVAGLEKRFAKEAGKHECKSMSFPGVKGFLASVERPRDLKVLTTDERVGVDLFVNGRLRERDVLKHIPTARVVENYLYGQLHYDALDDEQDRFTSSREGIVADDPKFTAFLDKLRKVLLKVVEDWDEWRIKHREEGDPDNTRMTKAQRASEGLYNAVAREFEPTGRTARARRVEEWVADLSQDARFNFESYAECFISENLIRTYIKDRKIRLSREAQEEVKKWKTKEADNKNKGNISIPIRRQPSDLSYLSMDGLANLVDKPVDRLKHAGLARDASEFKPMRDAMAHTALLTNTAKKRLRGVRENIKGRIKTLLTQGPKSKTKSPAPKKPARRTHGGSGKT
jgi:hypothetical protein